MNSASQDRSSWRTLCHEAVTKFEESCVAALEHKRAVRKFKVQPGNNLGVWPCDSCSWIRSSRIGKQSHWRQPIRRSPRVGFGAHVCYHCRISPPRTYYILINLLNLLTRFLAECRKRRLNQGSFVVLYFNLSALFDLYLVFACSFSCTALFVSISQVIGCEDRLRNDLYCVGWGVKLYSLTHSRSVVPSITVRGVHYMTEHR